MSYTFHTNTFSYCSFVDRDLRIGRKHFLKHFHSSIICTTAYLSSSVKTIRRPGLVHSDYSWRGDGNSYSPAYFTICISHCQSEARRFPSETSRPAQSCLTTTNPRQWRLCAFSTFLLGFTSQDFLFPATWMTLRAAVCSCTYAMLAKRIA